MKEHFEYESQPCAENGLISYRYPGTFSYRMIGAKNDEDALREANRSGFREPATLDKLEIWNSNLKKYIPINKVTRNIPVEIERLIGSNFDSRLEIRINKISVVHVKGKVENTSINGEPGIYIHNKKDYIIILLKNIVSVRETENYLEIYCSSME